ncbi:MAG: multidrug transporter [Cyclobacteriaceae bacterium]
MEESIVRTRKEKGSDAKKAGVDSVKPVIIRPKATLKALLVIVGFLLIANLIAIFLAQAVEKNFLTWRFIRYFDFNGENNIPAFFSSIILLIASAILFIAYRTESARNLISKGRYWLILSFIFVFLAVDENVAIHEEVTKVVRPLLGNDLSGFLHWAWVVPYFIAFLAVAAYFMRFVLNLPSFTRNLIFLSGFLFVFGAVGLELIEGYVYQRYGLNHIYNLFLYCVEELLEMVGVVIFIYALLDYLSTYHPQISIQK